MGIGYQKSLWQGFRLKTRIGIGPMVHRERTRHGSPYSFFLEASLEKPLNDVFSLSLGLVHLSNGAGPIKIPLFGGKFPNMGEDFLVPQITVDLGAIIRKERTGVRKRQITGRRLTAHNLQRTKS
ncbi:MAG: hypothetical protein WDN67_03985 [Candidatus Moraniibacteriota bacterium]